MADTSWITRLYQEDKALAEVARAMQERGIRVDQRKRRELDHLLRYRMASYLGKLRSASGLHALEPSKLGDLRKAIFRILHAPVMFRSDTTGQPTTGKEVLHTLASMKTGAGNFCKLLLAWRKAQKLRAVYVVNIEVEDDGAVHPCWRSWGTVTSRFSCKSPNLMNLPHDKKDELATAVKGMYIARKGYKFVAFDYRQLEPRIAAYCSGDPNMIKAVDSADYHAVNAELLFGKLPGEKGEPAYDRLRQAGKKAGLAINYLADVGTLLSALVSEGIQAEIGMVAAAHNRIHRHYKVYFDWQEAGLAFTQERGFIEALGQRRRWLGHTPSPTETCNFRIQAGAAWLMNQKTIELAAELPKAPIVAQVHDYLMFEVPIGQVDRYARRIQQVAESPVEVNGIMRSFPVDMKTGESWKEVS